MYSFSRKIDGKTIAPINEGVTQVAPLPDFTSESKYVKLTLQANVETNITLPDGVIGFEIDTQLTDLIIDWQGATGIPNRLTATTISAGNFNPGIIAPSERRSFTVGALRVIYLLSPDAGDVNIYVF